jgi:sensitive to high expression protein 9
VGAHVRYFADQKEIDKQIEDIKSRIDNSLEEPANAIKNEAVAVKEPQLGRETIIHTNPESSSFVHTSEAHNLKDPPSGQRPDHQHVNTSSLPSSVSAARSNLSKRFSHIMDNLQSNIFVASKRLNDLTGYSGIEAMKNDIQCQENLTNDCKQAVRKERDAYAAAVATRSATQREVNDLLHRKHAWNPTDLERFTSLYRSDHANEQAEAEAQAKLSEAEARYEEASSKLAKSILARYHEEQIWSDKIRQMSTWGTWGLMGLNVLLFIVFQIMIEPWRRRRLVRGFEDKVQEALKVQQARHEDAMAASAKVEDASLSGALVTLVVDGVMGASESEVEMLEEEAAFEKIVNAELRAEQRIEDAVEEALEERKLAEPQAAQGYAYYEEAFRQRFSEKQVVMTQRELTTVAIEGACGGAAIMGLLLVLLRPR